MIATSLQRKRYTLLTDVLKNRSCYVMVLPALLYTFVFGYMALPYLLTAFQKFDYRTGIFDSVWVGFKNFEFFFKSNNAATVTRNTIKLNVLFIVFVTIASIALAIFLNELKSRKFSKFFQSSYLMPHFLSWVVVSYIIFGLLSTNYGVVNKILVFFKLEPVNWYATAEPWTAILVFMRIWKTAGMQSVIFLAAIVGIDKQLYEAAEIDGAGRWKMMTSITLPLIAPTVAIVTLLAIGRIMYADFGMIYAIIGDNGILYETADVIDTYVFRTLRLLGNPAQAMAVGIYQAAIGFILVFGSNLLVKKTFKEGALF